MEKEEKAKAGQPYSFEPVVVTATRTEAPLSEVTKSLYVVDKKDMETQQQTSIPEAIVLCPGLRSRTRAGLGNTPLSISVEPAVSMFNFNMMVFP